MSKQVIKTNNDQAMLSAKIALRLESVNLLDKDEINVLECFAGDGVLWAGVRSLSKKKINILPIDIKKYNNTTLIGDNLKFLKEMDLTGFDIIDLDSYGSPSKQLSILAKKEYNGIIHCTFIQTMMGAIGFDVLSAYGYSKEMVSKCRTLFYKNGLDKILNFCSVKFGVKQFRIVTNERKNYFYFVVNQ